MEIKGSETFCGIWEENELKEKERKRILCDCLTTENCDKRSDVDKTE